MKAAKKRFKRLGGVALFVLFVTCCIASPALAFTASFKQTVTKNGEAIVHFDVLMKDKKMKAEVEMQGGRNIYIRNKRGTFSYLPDRAVAFRVPPFVDENLTDNLGDYMDFLHSNHAVKTGVEIVENYECDVYWFKAPNTELPTKAWVWREKSFPVKIETNAEDGILITYFYDISLDIPIAEAVFQLPSEITLIEPV